MQNFFRFAEYNTNYRNEVIGGLTTFLSMAYILFVNPAVLGDAGMNKEAVFVATALAAAVGSILMGVISNYPIALAPGMGLNAFFAYSVVMVMGIPWQTALAGVLLSGLLFVAISLSGIREMIINAIPIELKYATASGIGLFIAFIGLKNAGVIVNNDATLVSLGKITSGPVLLTVFGLIVSVIFMIRGYKGGIFYGMVLTSILGMITGLIDVPTKIVGSVPSIKPVFGVAVTELFNTHIYTSDLLVVVLTFLFVAFFDTAGTLMAVASQAGFIKDNKLPRANRALLADSLAIAIGAVIGTSSTTSYIESSSGVAAGGRTGFTAVVTACCFLLALFFAPLLVVVTSQVTAPALIIIGVLMASVLGNIEWTKLEIAVPAFLTVITMPLTYSIATGIALGFIMYPITMIAKGRSKEIHPIMYLLFVIFVAYFAFL